ncbi:hypothetical protein [Altibacter sp.]|uniref:hypothetical protein n=1 Tax=Altibacter sp. TaxID=2024823 RepID=UPI000C8D2C41|nr:hypothetical protein [Altibacter sp.]MAP55993.1 hypothetical protein [Altibacter sp.]
MKQKLLFISLLAIGFSPLLHAQQFKNALDYLEFISSEQEIITKNMWKYTKAIAHSKNERSVDGSRNSLIKSIERAISKIERAEGFDGDTYKNQVLENLRLNESLMKQDYEKIIDMKAVAEQSYDQMEAYILARELADKKMAEAQQEYETHFYAYAAKHNIDIIENESDLGKKMAISSEVFKHYNDMYLRFFKVNINDVYLWEAIEKGDVGAIQQNGNALQQVAAEGLKMLKDATLYKNDPSLVEATQTAFNFFIEESQTSIPEVVAFLLLNDEVESIKTTLEKTPERKRTKEQIDGYNRKVKEINKAIGNYNKLMAALNKDRQQIINNLNLANEKFLAKHIPKD